MCQSYRLIALCLLLALSAGCGGAGDDGETGAESALHFVVQVSQPTAEEFEIDLGYANQGDATIPADDAFDGAWELRDATGNLRASGQVHTLPELPPGEEALPLRWAGQLDPGVYRIVWGGRGRGHTAASFEVTQGSGGPRLGGVEVGPVSPEDPPFIE